MRRNLEKKLTPLCYLYLGHPLINAEAELSSLQKMTLNAWPCLDNFELFRYYNNQVIECVCPVSSLEPASGHGDCGHVQATPVQYSCPVQSVYKYWDITTWKYFTTITVIYVSNAWILSVNSEEKVSLEFTIQLVWVVSLSDFTVLCCGFINLLILRP